MRSSSYPENWGATVSTEADKAKPGLHSHSWLRYYELPGNSLGTRLVVYTVCVNEVICVNEVTCVNWVIVLCCHHPPIKGASDGKLGAWEQTR